jgi:hypothetical protein
LIAMIRSDTLCADPVGACNSSAHAAAVSNLEIAGTRTATFARLRTVASFLNESIEFAFTHLFVDSP